MELVWLNSDLAQVEIVQKILGDVAEYENAAGSHDFDISQSKSRSF